MLGLSFRTSFVRHTAYGHTFADATFGHRFCWGGSALFELDLGVLRCGVQLYHFGGEHLLQQSLSLDPCFGTLRPI